MSGTHESLSHSSLMQKSLLDEIHLFCYVTMFTCSQIGLSVQGRERQGVKMCSTAALYQKNPMLCCKSIGTAF